MSAKGVSGRVLQVSLGPGGVPNLPVQRAWVGRMGLEGDRHREDTVHGGPHRAVCLFGLEVIRRLQAEGHPLGPGSVGENLTTEGIEWSTLPVGTRAQVGDQLVLELSSPATPCNTQKPNFLDGRFARMSIRTHPTDSRMYARVLAEGEVRPGDTITLLPPAPDGLARTHVLLDRIDACEQESVLALWRAAATAGRDVRILDDGELSACAAPDMPGPIYNNAVGLRSLPHLLPRVLDHYRAAGVVGWVPIEEPPWEGAEPDYTLLIHAAEPASVPEEQPPDGVSIRTLEPREWATWADLMATEAPSGVDASQYRDPAPHLLATRGSHILVAEEAGRPIGIGSLHVHGRVGLLRGGLVVSDSRGHGIQRALISARVRMAEELGCDLVTSQAAPGSISQLNLARMGMEPIWRRPVHRFDPSTSLRA